jgi:hypothetical protein
MSASYQLSPMIIEFCVSSGVIVHVCPLTCILSPVGERAG